MEARDALETAFGKADVPCRAVTMVDDPSRGFAVRVELAREVLRERAAEVLGQFTIPFTVVVDADIAR